MNARQPSSSPVRGHVTAARFTSNDPAPHVARNHSAPTAVARLPVPGAVTPETQSRTARAARKRNSRREIIFKAHFLRGCRSPTSSSSFSRSPQRIRFARLLKRRLACPAPATSPARLATLGLRAAPRLLQRRRHLKPEVNDLPGLQLQQRRMDFQLRMVARELHQLVPNLQVL